MMTGQTFQPVNDDHAIDRVEFALTFSRPFEATDLQIARSHHDKWKADLPRVSEPTIFAFNVDGLTNALRPDPMQGLEFSFVRPDGSAVWALRLLGNLATVECTRYSRWVKVWGSAKRHLENVLDVLSFLPNPISISQIALTVVDVFTSEAAAYDLQFLFRKSDLLPTSSFERGPSWHSHIGWFDQVESCRLLHNLNIDSAERPAGPAGALAAVSITHTMVLGRPQLADGAELSTAAELSTDKAWLDRSMESLHIANKDVITSLVAPAILQRIGLKAPE